ncbi:segregation/condensation protein A [Aerosakkonemataceae cyanobacterium BLCC-F154]|uniref:Segregation and condensation protein A n=1 Tax=Floridaenema fluviatile BLCC-F154 TaxID=3153640 RepID=A0ABV4YFP9_9CYAN
MAVSPTPETKSVREISAISLLIDLAERGEIDPWDVQVIEVIDLALSQLAALNDTRSGSCEADLSQSGQAFLDASLLVLLKAKTLEELELFTDEADVETEAEIAELDDWGNPLLLPRNLERQLRRRPTPAPPTRRRVTLQELIDQLRLVAAAIEKKPPKIRTSPLRSQSRTQAMRVAMELVNEENSVEVAAELEHLLATFWSEDTEDDNWLDLDLLVHLWWQRKQRDLEVSTEIAAQLAVVADDSAQTVELEAAETFSVIHPSPQELVNERVNVFWALLMLSAQSKVELVQEEFYQDLKIRTLVEVEENRSASPMSESVPGK